MLLSSTKFKEIIRTTNVVTPRSVFRELSCTPTRQTERRTYLELLKITLLPLGVRFLLPANDI